MLPQETKINCSTTGSNLGSPLLEGVQRPVLMSRDTAPCGRQTWGAGRPEVFSSGNVRGAVCEHISRPGSVRWLLCSLLRSPFTRCLNPHKVWKDLHDLGIYYLNVLLMRSPSVSGWVPQETEREALGNKALREVQGTARPSFSSVGKRPGSSHSPPAAPTPRPPCRGDLSTREVASSRRVLGRTQPGAVSRPHSRRLGA